MNDSNLRPSPRASLEDLSVLCHHIAALSRAGVPLEQGFRTLAEELPDKLATQSQRMREKLEAGEDLADAMSDQLADYPNILRSVIEAGLRSGRLTVALEGFARLARQCVEVQRLVISSLIYPMIFLLLMCWISFGMLRHFGPALHAAILDLRPRSTRGDWISQLFDWAAMATEWFWVVPVVFLCLGTFWFVASAKGGPVGGRANWLRWIPGVSRLLDNSRLQIFTEVLAMLVEQQVPMAHALQLAGEATGDTHLSHEAQAMAEAIERGESPTDISIPKAAIPPFLRWTITHSQNAEQVRVALQRATETYGRRTEFAAHWLQRSLPWKISLTLGGLACTLYVATVLVPWFGMMRVLSQAMGRI